jgi:hypothetical protein
MVVAATSLALGAIAPAVSADSPKAFHLDKTCESMILCTIVTDTFKAIPPDTNVNYTFDNSDPWDGLTFPTIAVRNGSTTGICDWNQADPAHPDVLAKCTFASGTGRLTQFHLAVDVTVTGDPELANSIWHWDGWCWFGGSADEGHGSK